jgi:DNA-binding MarR family transcriptional regulator
MAGAGGTGGAMDGTGGTGGTGSAGGASGASGAGRSGGVDGASGVAYEGESRTAGARDAEVPWLDAREQRAWRGYRRMRTLLDLRLARDLNRDSGLSEPDYDVLSTLSETPGSGWRAGDLAARLSWSTSRLTHHTTRMQARGLVAREASPEDGRGAVIGLTDAGWAVLRDAAPPHVRSVRAHFIDLLAQDEIDVLAAISEKVTARLAIASGITPYGPREEIPDASCM